MLILILSGFSITLMEYHFSIKNHLQKMYICWNNQVEEPQLSAWFTPEKRPDVITTTDWLAPVIWDGTYNRRILDEYYEKLNITIGLAVCGYGKLRDLYLKPFLDSADKHFMVGHRVIIYILTDDFNKLPYVELGPRRTFKVLPLLQPEVWQASPLNCLSSLYAHLQDDVHHEVNFLFAMAVYQIFKYDFGVETLGRSVAQLHAWWYFKKPHDFPYEKRATSAAFIPFGKGDFYYHHAIVGGTPLEVSSVIKQYREGKAHDAANKLTSIYESYLNKYFFFNKPTKLLSPEYNWDPNIKTPPQIKCVKIAWQCLDGCTTPFIGEQVEHSNFSSEN
ncbi:N-acetyllactosaminide alpha-1,3-galactosyltransferase-like 1 [Octodon degus]|uniref:N-acetyllactosaminide alpha-1,3-galactosyltransferase-like 1 n=1 Tax=Octodon degus TaxID=10160 RepID=A0A6P3VDK1_OCTDE|nr:N-acetyllactosaminide alpha-1,3-galactosyltransferase-like 1 [Octodon degus]